MTDGSPAPVEVQDLDQLVRPARYMKLGGSQYRLPGDLPLEIYLALNAGDDDEDETVGINRVLQTLADLFAWEAPDVEKEPIRATVTAVLRGRGLRYLLSLAREIYREKEDAAEGEERAAEGEPVPTPAPVDGTPSTPSSEPTPVSSAS